MFFYVHSRLIMEVSEKKLLAFNNVLPVLYIVVDSNILIGPISNSDVVSPGSFSTASLLSVETHL